MKHGPRILILTLGFSAALLAVGASRQTENQTCAVTIRLVDATTGRELPGLISLTREEGEVFLPPELLPRGLGISKNPHIARWSVLPDKAVVRLDRVKWQLAAISGLEYEEGRISLDLREKKSQRIEIPLVRFADMRSKGWRSANTHLHLMKIDRATCDRYLLEVPQADDLDGVFISHLERAGADTEYISNQYTSRDLQELERRSRVRFGNGEEHRNDSVVRGEQGYGHVMLLNLRKLVHPVSIGPGIMKTGTDGIPLARGIGQARQEGATIVWCHNAYGLEAIANFVTGRVQAQNIFDGGNRGGFEDSFYRYLNAGISVPFSTGTDWFQYDFSRVYCETGGDATVSQWLAALEKGRTFITNGPLIELQVNGTGPGGTVDLPRSGGDVQVKARLRGRIDFRRAELILNGRPVKTVATKKVGGHYEVEWETVLPITQPCWLALRTPPPPIPGSVVSKQSPLLNELGNPLFSHTSAIYVTVGGKRRFDRQVAEELLAEIRQNRASALQNGRFADNQEKARVADVYDEAIKVLTTRLAASPTGT